MDGSETFVRLFRALHLSREVHVNVFACGEGGDAGRECSRRNLDVNKGDSECFFGGRLCNACAFDIGSSNELLSSILAEELAHVATYVADRVDTGVSCENGEMAEACGDRIRQTIEKELEKSAPERENN